jgi:hypothetical protein
MLEAVIVIAVTEKGLGGVKIWHGPGKKSLDKTLDLYRRIAPGMKYLERLATGKGHLKDAGQSL